MANELWVKWTGGVRATRVQVQDPGRPAEIDDLCRKFVLDRKWPTVDPASLQVFDREGDGRTEQTSSTKLKNFFVDYSEGAPNNGPGQSEGTALFIFVGGTPKAAAGAAVQNANFSNSVFVLYQQTGKGPDPIATAFAVSDSLLLTAAHNVVTREDEDKAVDIEKVDDAREQKEQPDDMVVDNLMISPVLLKSFDGTIRAEEGRRVEMFRYHYHHDWAFLKVCDGKLADFIPLARNINELPERGTKEKMDVFNCTVKIFRDMRREATLHAFPKEVGVGIVGEKFMSFQNSGFKGSCGGPYIFRNKAVALHVESHNDAYDYEMLEEEAEEEEIRAGTRRRKRTKRDRTLEVAESTVSSHSSIGTGLILQARSGLMKVFNGEIGEIDAEEQHKEDAFN